MNQERGPRSAPLLDDQPSAVDLLNFEQFAVALREVILNPQTKTPFIIGILGRWGTGKSTLMRMLERQLETQKTTTVWFSAWLYNQEEEIWASFLQSLITRLAARLPLLEQLRFSMGVLRSGFTWSKLLYEMPRLLATAALVAAPAIITSMLAATAGSRVLEGLLQSGGIVTSVLLGAWYFARPAVRAVRSAVAPDFSLYRSLDFERHIGFLDRFREQFGRIVAALPDARARVVVFVDDLDRCGPEKALDLLDAIKVFLDVPNCIFVLGVDLTVIQRALALKYEDDPVAQKEYLGKIIQLPFHLPPLTEADLDSYLRGLDVVFPDERCRDVFLASLSRNPREIKRVINTYSLQWYLAQARVTGGAVTPVRLAKVVVIQQAFPPLFALLRDQPHLLALLEQKLRAQAGGAGPNGGQAAETLVDSTLVVSPSGVAVPPSLLPFVTEPALIRLLTMHPWTLHDQDDANFEQLNADEIAVYFTLTRRAPAPGETEASTRQPYAASTSTENFPDFGPNYTVLQKLAVGGVGEVYLAESRALGRKVAIKALVSTLVGDATWIARFDREIQLLARVSVHPNIVDVFDSGMGHDADGRPLPFYVMEHLPGETLDRLIAREGALDLARTRALLIPVFDALQHIHDAGIIHRDLKPSAILISAYGVPKLADFSLALDPVEGRDQLTSVGQLLGTPAYMSPEQLTDARMDVRSDLYSLGLIIFECLTGKNPYSAASFNDTIMAKLGSPAPEPTSYAPDLPKEIDDFMSRMLAREPDTRFQSAKEARVAFESVPARAASLPLPSRT